MGVSLLAAWDRLVTGSSRMKRLPPRLLSFIDDSASILDVGAGAGQLARRLQQANPTITVTGVDVLLQPDACMPVVRYDGVRLPFPDSSFDTVMLVDVLHHDEEPERVLREAARVARRRILIKDHYWVSRWDRAVLSLADYLGNRAHGVALPYNFLRMEQWRAAFARAAVRVLRVEQFRYSAWDRTKQVIFLLEPPDADAARPSGAMDSRTAA